MNATQTPAKIRRLGSGFDVEVEELLWDELWLDDEEEYDEDRELDDEWELPDLLPPPPPALAIKSLTLNEKITKNMKKAVLLLEFSNLNKRLFM